MDIKGQAEKLSVLDLPLFITRRSCASRTHLKNSSAAFPAGIPVCKARGGGSIEIRLRRGTRPDRNPSGNPCGIWLFRARVASLRPRRTPWVHLRPCSLPVRGIADIAAGDIFEMGSRVQWSHAVIYLGNKEQIH